MRAWGRTCVLLALLPLGLGTAALADDTPRGPVYSLGVVASDRIDNDRLSATLAVRVDGDDPATLADEINRRMRAALDAIASLDALEVQTRDYRITPVPDPKRRSDPLRWSGSQTLLLQSADMSEVATAIERLQAELQVQSLDFSVSADTLAAASDRLIVDALLRFEARAALLARTLDAVDHRVIDADVSTEEGRFGVQPRMAMRADSQSSAAPPALAAGSTELSVRVSGRIELLDE